MSSNKVFASQFFGIQSPCTQRCKNNATNLQRFIESAWYESGTLVTEQPGQMRVRGKSLEPSVSSPRCCWTGSPESP